MSRPLSAVATAARQGACQRLQHCPVCTRAHLVNAAQLRVGHGKPYTCSPVCERQRRSHWWHFQPQPSAGAYPSISTDIGSATSLDAGTDAAPGKSPILPLCREC